ncbi:M23 family metallopeptidase [Escherichia coli]|nr:M23 family metallopeptidase [Escherichia coli]
MYQHYIIFFNKGTLKMIISPPFLTHPNNSGIDESWIDWMMPVDQFRNYPINLRGSWHGGIHISYTNAEDKIRAIADGTVVYVRTPSSVEKRDSAPLNYNGPTDDGCVVIKHETEIGDGESGKVTYWSVYMHLNEIEGRVTQGSKIYRKDVLGTPGLADGDKEFHFQIFSDDENTKKLTGREELEPETDLTKDGRTEVVYGDIHFYLPVDTIFYDKIPENNSAETTGLSPVYTSMFPLFVTMKFDTGNCEMVTRMKKEVSEGEIDEYVYETVGEALINKDGDKYEYNLYKTAMKLYPQRPSSGFELLRFGRVINSEHEVLTPSNAPLWRTVNYPGGHGVVNLADPNIKKYSDGDFPHWMGWRLVDDDSVHDSQCHSDTINNWKGSKHFASSCQRAICHFNQEWEASSLEERFNWLLVDGEDEFSRKTDEKARLG